MIIEKDLFEIPVYRILEERYYKEMREYIEKIKKEFDERFLNESYVNKYSRKKFGGSWDYNEIIGYLKIYRWGSQIRVYHWETDSKRKVRKGRKRFRQVADNYCCYPIYKNDDDNIKFIKIMKEVVEQCKDIIKERNKKFYVDTRIFDSVVDYINWKDLFYAEQKMS